MKKILLATTNSHKTQEIQTMLGSEYLVEDLSSMPQIGDIIEDADTFEGNANIKALAVSAHTEAFVLADDSGLCVDALDGAPGIYSARYAGPHADMEENKKLLLENLKNSSQREAAFVCVLSIAQGGEIVTNFRGECTGTIIQEERGAGGFGYDPLFIPTGYDQTFAELPAQTKNELSHRAHAMAQFLAWLNDHHA